MADQKKFTAHINRKGLDATGVTEDHARGMAGRLGSATMLIVEARHVTQTIDAEGNVSVALALTNVEPVPAELDERVREFQRALYRQRPDQEGQAALRGTSDGASPDDALASMESVWDGDLDAPLSGELVVEPCPAPGCLLGEHDGDDHVTDAADLVTLPPVAEEQGSGSVVTPDFSNRQTKKG